VSPPDGGDEATDQRIDMYQVLDDINLQFRVVLATEASNDSVSRPKFIQRDRILDRFCLSRSMDFRSKLKQQKKDRRNMDREMRKY
jgi:hypothetical protein